MAALCVLAGAATLAGQRRGGPPQVTTQTPVVGTGAISGIVVDGSTGQPLAGAVVLVGGAGVRGTSDPRRRVTDSQGRYVFTQLPAGTYGASATRHGYSNARYGQDDPAALATRSIQLTDGQWFPDGRIVMWRTSAISGTVTDEAGEPVVGLIVRVMTRLTIAGRPQVVGGPSAKTDDLGRYRVSGLNAGSYVVFVPSVQAAVPSSLTLEELAGWTAESVNASEAAGRQSTLPDPIAIVADAATRLITGPYPTPPPIGSSAFSYPPTFLPNARSVADAATIYLGRGEQRSGADLRLAPVRAVRVSGVVQGPAGSTPARMTVRLVPSGNEAMGFGSEAATALVAADGTFTLVNVPSGAYSIVVSRNYMEYQTGDASAFYALPSPPGCTGGGSGFFTLYSGLRAGHQSCGGEGTFAARMPLTVPDRDLAGVVVQLQRAVSISGRIEYESGPPAPDSIQAKIGLTVFAEPANGDALLGLPSGQSVPGDLTRFRVDGLLPGAYVLQPLNPTNEVLSIQWQGRDYAHRPFDTTAGRDIEDVVITLAGNAAAVLRGSVRDGKGGTAASGLVIAFPTDRTLWTNYGLRPARLRSAQINTGGAFTLPIPAGDYFVVAIEQASTDWMDPKFLEAASALASRVPLARAENKSVDLSISTVKVGR